MKFLRALIVFIIFFSTSVYAEEVEKLIAKISFKTELNLSYQDLIRNLGIKPGMRFSEKQVSYAVNALYKRGIFSEIEPVVKTDGSKVEIEFLLKPKRSVSRVYFEGNTTVSEADLKRTVQIKEGGSFTEENLRLSKDSILGLYIEYGFYKAEVSSILRASKIDQNFVLTFTIVEGPRSAIDKIEILGEVPVGFVEKKDRLFELALGSQASKENIENIRKAFLVGLRNEGYLQATVQLWQSSYQIAGGNLELVYKLNPGTPITIIFFGNKILSSESLLEPLKINTRTVPFTPNAVRTLVREIKSLYQDYGYYHVQAESEEIEVRAGRRRFVVKIEEGPKSHLEQIAFKGNNNISSRLLKKQITSTEAAPWFFKRWQPGYLVQSKIDSDKYLIEEFYHSHGYFGTKVETRVEELYSKSSLSLHFEIQEGEQKRVEQINFHWKDANLHLENQHFKKLFAYQTKLELGEPFDQEKIRIEKAKLLNLIRENGFPDAKVEVSYNQDLGVLRFLIEIGEFRTIDNVYFSGNTFTHDYVIEEELSFQPGDVWNERKVTESINNLYQRGLFKTVSFEKLESSPKEDSLDILVNVQERDTGSLGFGIGFDTEDGLQLSGEFAQRNLAGTGNGLVFGFDGFFKSGDKLVDAGYGRIVYIQPRLFGSKTTLYKELFGQFSNRLIDQYSFDRIGAQFSFRRELLEGLGSNLSLSFYEQDLFDVEPDVILGSDDSGDNFYSKLSFALDYDKRNDVYNPQKGYRLILGASYSDSAFGSDVDYYGFKAKSSVFVSLSPRFVWANNLSASYLEPLSNTDVIPVSERLFLGGRNSLRGFSRYAIGPRSSVGNIVGGDRSLFANTEFQYWFKNDFIGVIFLDMGQAILKNSGTFDSDPLSFSFSDFRFSPGLGIRYKTPIGPIAVDYGFALDREFGEGFGRLNVGIGLSF